MVKYAGRPRFGKAGQYSVLQWKIATWGLNVTRGRLVSIDTMEVTRCAPWPILY